jgi:tetratricopeptide (TPR) repeat protein
MDNRIQQLWRRGLDHLRIGNLEAAQACFEGVLLREPTHAAALLRLATIHLRRGAHATAIQFAEQALALTPGRMEVLALLARAHLASASLARARDSAVRALDCPRENLAVVESLGMVLSQLGEHASAIEMFDAAIAMSAPAAVLFFNRAIAHRSVGNMAAYEQDILACLTLDSGHTKAHWHLAQLRRQGIGGGHATSLPQLMARAPRDRVQYEILGLSLFQELDSLGRYEEAWKILEDVLASRQLQPARPLVDWPALRQVIDGPLPAPTEARGPVFIIGLPRSGVAVLGRLLERHPKLRSLGSVPAFSLRLDAALSRSAAAVSHWQNSGAAAALHELDFDALGRDYLEHVAVDAGPMIFESHPINALLAGAIARALPQARFLHVTRDPMDNALSLLTLPRADAGLENEDVPRLLRALACHQQMMRHWQENLPGRIMDVQYESLVQKPEMVLRVACAFLGLRFKADLDTHELHDRCIGRVEPYAKRLQAIAAES